MTFGSRSGQQANSGAVTRISGDSSWNKNLENIWDWTAINAPVKLTRGNVNAVYINKWDQSVPSHKRSGKIYYCKRKHCLHQ